MRSVIRKVPIVLRVVEVGVENSEGGSCRLRRMAGLRP